MKQAIPCQKKVKEIHKWLEKWRKALFLNGWKFEILFPVEEHHDAIADVIVDSAYLTAVIRFYPNYFDAPNDIREHALVHELCHCLTAELQDVGINLMRGYLVTEKNHQDILERLTQRISYIAMRECWPVRKYGKG